MSLEKPPLGPNPIFVQPPEPKPDRLAIMLNMQSELQEKSYGKRLEDLEGEERIEMFKQMYIALVDELHESLGEMGWKPWATSKHFRDPAVQGELIDAWHFFMNLLILSGLDPEKMFQMYMAKHDKNKKRQEDGYDGVSTKCQGCGRALDDEAVECHVSTLEKYLGKHCCHDSDPFGRMIL